MGSVLEREELKAIIKESVTEVLAQNRELFAEVVEEVLEDKRFMAALRAGESSDLVRIFEPLMDADGKNGLARISGNK